MKFLHLADLHIGKRVHGFSMLEDQAHILAQICTMAKENQVDAVLIAGDIYDKTIPVCEAVGLFDSFLTSLHQAGISVLAISGNHDSPERLDFGGKLMQESNVWITGTFCDPLSCVTIPDAYGTVCFYFLPFVKPASVSSRYELKERTSQCAVQTVLEAQKIDSSKRNVLIAHQFVTAGGSLPERSDSEILPVGGLDTVDAAVFTPFDYVALGHIHRPQRIGRDTVRYAGSPLKYSFSEARYPKTVPLVTMKEKGDIEIALLPLTPLHEMREVSGQFADILSKESMQNGDPTDYLHITLTDEEELIDVFSRLQHSYPNLMKLDFDNRRMRTIGVTQQTEQMRKKSVLEQFDDFFEQVNGKPMNDSQREQVRRLWEGGVSDEAD
jgi:exonuclease SbcD